MEKRFLVCEGSLTGSESMTHSIIDTLEKGMYDLERMVCECPSEDIANDIARSMNDVCNAGEPKQKKVEKSHIDAMVESLTFKFARVGDSNVTGCWAFLPNKYKVGYGESIAFLDEEFDEKVGKDCAKERCIANATQNLFEFEGYLLKMTGRTSDRSSVLISPVVLEMVISDFEEFQDLTHSLVDNYSELPAPVLEALDKFITKYGSDSD